MSTTIPNPAALSLEEKKAYVAELLRQKKRRIAPLSSAQQRLWFVSQMEGDSYAYNIFGGLRLQGPLHVDALRRALQEIVRRHDSLRTSFTVVDGMPMQVITVDATLNLPVVDLTTRPAPERQQELYSLASAECRRPFDLTRGPLLRASLIRLEDRDHALLLTMHHIVSDGWSLTIIQNELARLYAAFSAGEPSPLPELTIQYSDYARWQQQWLQSGETQSHIAYWKQTLHGVPPVLDLPTDYPRPALQTTAGAHFPITIPSELASGIRDLAQSEGCTLFMALLAAFNILLWRWSGQEDVVIGTPVAGRDRAETEGLIGLFLNNIVLRTDLSGNPSFRQLLRRVRDVAVGAYAHAEFPFEKLVDELGVPRDLARSPLFQTMFILQVPQKPLHLAGLEIESLQIESGTSKLDLTLFLSEYGSTLAGHIEYNTDLFGVDTAERMASHLVRLLQAAVADPELPAGELAMLTDAESNRILNVWNDTVRQYSSGRCLHELLQAQALRTPDRIAAAFEAQSLSCRELDERSARLAAYLRRFGAGPGKRVGVCLDRSLDMLVAVLGVLKSGAAYVPLDPAFPSGRVELMMEDSAADVLVTESRLLDRFQTFTGSRVVVDRDRANIAAEPSQPVASGVKPEDLAYVIYTSGSTGKPKGVMIPHRALVNLLESMQREPGLKSDDVLLAVTTLSFDIAGLELYLPLLAGARVEIVGREVAIDGRRLIRELERSGATVMQATPATWRMLIEAGWKSDGRLKVLCGGEAMPRALAEQLLERAGSVWNVYGPTETTIWSTVAQVTTGSGPVLIGRPIANTTMYILDRNGKPVPPGVVGELHIGGVGLARGYWRRAELTAEKFIANPVPGRQQERIYRTGDLARYRADGQIECLGRIDHQVKLRGYRIELGEIESVLAKHDAVRECAVSVGEDNSGEKRLIGYVVPVNGTSPDSAGLRAHLQSRLPDYMVPSAFVMLDRLPLTPNGKVDRKALPAPDAVSDAGTARERVLPRTELEKQIASVWEEVIGLQHVGITDNFFELGGHSLLAVRLFARIEKVTGHNLPLATLFGAPTVEQLARRIEQNNWHDAWSPVVELQHGSSSPFFCIHSLGANLVSYSRLAGLVEHQFYGLQPHGLDGQQQVYSSIEDMAAAYIREVRQVQPAGPYRLGGVCLGGVIAFEMAQQLTAAGEEVSFLLLIDSDLPGVAEHLHTRPYLLFLADWHIGELLRPPVSRSAAYAAGKLRNAAVRMFRALFGTGKHKSTLEKAITRIADTHSRALMKYKPLPYPGKATLFWCSETPVRAYEDRRLAWSNVVQGGLEVHAIPGNHSTMIENPHVSIMAEKLKACLRQPSSTEKKIKTV